MLIIDGAAALDRALTLPIDPDIKRLLSLRRDLVDLGDFIVVQTGDSLADVEAAAGIPIATNIVDGLPFGDPEFTPSFEWALDHGGLVEMPYILTDDGAGVVLIVPDQDGIEPTLLAMARQYAEAAAG